MGIFQDLFDVYGIRQRREQIRRAIHEREARELLERQAEATEELVKLLKWGKST